MSRNRRPAAVIMVTLGLAGLVSATSGCSLASPKTIATPYAASDGTNAELTVDGSTVKLRDFLLVSQAKGAPGVLFGAISTDGNAAVPLKVSVVDPSGSSAVGATTVTAQPGQLTQIGPGGAASLQVAQVPLPPGSVLQVNVASSSGSKTFPVPVLAPENQYASLTPSQASSPTATATGSPSPSPSASPTASASASPSPSPS